MIQELFEQEHHCSRIRKYISSPIKPSFTIDEYGVYTIIGGERTDGVRPIVYENFFGLFGDALSFAILQPEFYAHFLDIRRPFNDDPANEFNGFIADSRKCKILQGNFLSYDGSLEKRAVA